MRVLACLVLALAACAPRRPDGPPDVIVVSVDTLRRDALAAFDPAAGPLPELDALAASSVRYENALSTASWTLPAHASLFTGLYPDRHGATDQRVTLSEDVATLAETLARRGYQTIGLTGGGFLDARYGLGRGFERYASGVRGAGKEIESAASLTARLRTELAARDRGRPLFLFLHSYAVHSYYDVRAEAVARIGREDLGTRRHYLGCLTGKKPCDEAAWQVMRALYRAELELFDGELAVLRTELQREGLWDEAFVVVLSDHGEGFEPERGRIHHGGRLNADLVRIPLLVRGPGIAPRDETGAVSLVDVMPTLLELTGTPVPAGLDGRSLVANLMHGAPLEPRALLAMEHYYGWRQGKRGSLPDVQSLPRERALIDGQRWYITGETPDELYELSDVGQVASGGPDAAQAGELRALFGARPFPRAASRAVEQDQGTRDELEALGYGGGE